MFDVEINLLDVQRALQKASAAAARETQKQVARVAWEAANDAKENHPYRNRTGKLEANTKVETRREANDPLVARVIAQRPYASYVEGKWKYRFLSPAVERRTTRAALTDFGDQIALAIEKAFNGG